jgi:hypothetical protein
MNISANYSCKIAKNMFGKFECVLQIGVGLLFSIRKWEMSLTLMFKEVFSPAVVFNLPFFGI